MANKTANLNVREEKETKAPSESLNISEMTEEQFNKEIDKGYQSMLRGEAVPAEEAFSQIKRSNQ